MNGSPIDACSYAIYVALSQTKIPKTEIYMSESNIPDDFEVCGDISEAVLFNCEMVPICMTVVKVSGDRILTE
jgi:exosome complex RNA-binding protein Rrp42 (RNase PH superfamily)